MPIHIPGQESGSEQRERIRDDQRRRDWNDEQRREEIRGGQEVEKSGCMFILVPTIITTIALIKLIT